MSESPILPPLRSNLVDWLKRLGPKKTRDLLTASRQRMNLGNINQNEGQYLSGLCSLIALTEALDSLVASLPPENPDATRPGTETEPPRVA